MRPDTFSVPAQLAGQDTSYSAARVAHQSGGDVTSGPTPQHPDRITATINVTAQITGFSRSEIYRLLTAGDLKAVKRGRKTLILMNSVTGYLASLPLAEFRGGAR